MNADTVYIYAFTRAVGITSLLASKASITSGERHRAGGSEAATNKVLVKQDKRQDPPKFAFL